MDNDVRIGNVLQAHEARCSITWSGQIGDLDDPIPFDADDGDVKQMVTEAVRSRSVRGISQNVEAADFTDFVVDRFTATTDRPWNSVVLRPKTPFGG